MLHAEEYCISIITSVRMFCFFLRKKYDFYDFIEAFHIKIVKVTLLCTLSFLIKSLLKTETYSFWSHVNVLIADRAPAPIVGFHSGGKYPFLSPIFANLTRNRLAHNCALFS